MYVYSAVSFIFMRSGYNIAIAIIANYMWNVAYTVHDMENVRGCSVPASTDSCAVRCGSSARTDTNLPCGFWLKMAETRRQTSCAAMLKDWDRHRKDCLYYHCRNRDPFDLYCTFFVRRWSGILVTSNSSSNSISKHYFLIRCDYQCLRCIMLWKLPRLEGLPKLWELAKNLNFRGFQGKVVISLR